jgi:hypothetical protein
LYRGGFGVNVPTKTFAVKQPKQSRQVCRMETCWRAASSGTQKALTKEARRYLDEHLHLPTASTFICAVNISFQVMMPIPHTPLRSNKDAAPAIE